MFLQIVSFTGDIGNDDLSVGQLDTSDLTDSGIGFLWLGGVDLVANTLLLITLVECWSL